MDVVVILSVLLGDVQRDGAGREGDGIGQHRLGVAVGQVHRDLYDAGVDVLAAAEAASCHVKVRLEQFPEEDEHIDEQAEEAARMDEAECLFMDEKA